MRRYYKKIGEKFFFNKLESYNSSPVCRATVSFRNCGEYEERLLENYFFGLALHMWRIDGFTKAARVAGNKIIFIHKSAIFSLNHKIEYFSNGNDFFFLDIIILKISCHL